MTTEPGLIHAPLISSGRPTAATTMSASAAIRGRSTVREWQKVTVALLASSNILTGLPGMELRPMTSACKPVGPMW
jgi:hypothetical protein